MPRKPNNKPNAEAVKPNAAPIASAPAADDPFADAPATTSAPAADASTSPAPAAAPSAPDVVTPTPATDAGSPDAPTFIDTSAGDGGSFLDLSKADEIAALIPKGTRVTVSCRSCEPKLSSSGNPMLNYRMQIERVNEAPIDTPPEMVMMWPKRSIFGRFMFTMPNPATGSRGTIGQTRDAFKAFGVEWAARQFRTRDEFMAWLNEIAPLFVGAIADAVVGVDEPNPNNPQSIDPATGEPYPAKNTVYGFRAANSTANAMPKNTPLNVRQHTIEDSEELPF